MQLDEFLEALQAAVESGRMPLAPCLLCQRPTQNTGLWLLGETESIGPTPRPPGSMRCATYPLCPRHPRDTRTMGRIETLLKRRLESTGTRNFTSSATRNN